MKKISLMLFVCLTASGGAIMADRNEFNFRLGGMQPQDPAVFGFRGGLAYGGYVDKLVSVSFSADYYQTSYSIPANALQANSYAFTTTQSEKSLTFRLLMPMINARIDIPYAIAGLVTPFFQVGMGYDFAFVNTTTFGNFSLELGTGARMPLGEQTKLIVYTGYHFSTVAKFSSDGLDEKINVNGFFLQAGICFSFEKPAAS